MTPLKLKRMGIDTHQEPVVYMRIDCPVCRSEGFSAHSRVEVITSHRKIIATLNVVHDGLLAPDEVGLSEAAWKLLSPGVDETASFAHPPPVTSFSDVRAKLYGNSLSDKAFESIIRDVVDGKYTDIQLAAFLTACVGDRLNQTEMTGLTKAMILVGEKIDWGRTPIVDKHSVGGLPGNRTTPIIVSIVAAAGLIMPKTSSRAITSPSGTADTMATLTNVTLDLKTIRQVVDKEGGCIAWGGAVHLSPADDILIRVERALDVDSEGQLVASILSKKAAAGATHVVIDLPVGPTAKVRSADAAATLKKYLETTGTAVGLKVYVDISNGDKPVGFGIGPALEAHDIINVLQNKPEAPADLRKRSLELASKIIEISGLHDEKKSREVAENILSDGRAWAKFQAICEAQGGLRLPPKAPFTSDILSSKKGTISGIDNRKLAMVAKLAGAPEASAAGVYLKHTVGDLVAQGEPLFVIHAETHGELEYALHFVSIQNNIFWVI